MQSAPSTPPTMLLLVALLPVYVSGCLPGLGIPGYGFAPPAYNYGYGGRAPYVAGGLPAVGGYPYALGPRLGPFRSEASRDQVHSVSMLNCRTFEDACKWSNTDEEELEWSTVKAQPESQQWMASLGTSTYPDPAAGSLVSQHRRGWEGGQLVSDELPCINSGLRLTATVWRSRVGPLGDQPKLQVCSKTMKEVRFPLVNCNEVDIRNGVPITVDVPPPSDVNAPAQIVIYGNNFVAPEGGAIFIQDIELDGHLDCGGDILDSHPKLLDEDIPAPAPQPPVNRGVGPLKPFEAMNSRLDAMDGSSGSMFDQSGPVRAPPPPTFDNILKPQSNSVFEQCLALSCNPSDLKCKFWRSSGNNRWEIGTAGRVSNPLTGIHLPPGTAQKFLVAPFLDLHINSYTLVSEQLNIPLGEEVYFCFYEFLATHGLTLSVCTDKNECFYKKSTLALGNGLDANKKWNVRCSRLPPGIYELRVIAENMGDNKGEIGFLPIRLAKDPYGEQFIC